MHGDDRGSYRRDSNVIGGVIRLAPHPRLEQTERDQLAHHPFRLNRNQRAVVEQAVREVCVYRDYGLRAVNVRSNHAHTVVSALCSPEGILNAFKSYSTRSLRRNGLVASNIKPWARHGSTIYLWKEEDVGKAVEYVVFGQDYPFSID